MMIVLATGATSYYFMVVLPRVHSESIAYQAECADQAVKTLASYKAQYTNDGWNSVDHAPASTRMDFRQSNHYNEQLQECFVLISFGFNPQADPTLVNSVDTGESLLDGFENRELASCVHSENLQTGRAQDVCGIPNGGNLSYPEYRAFVDQRMGGPNR